jgi:hypothetical protein
MCAFGAEDGELSALNWPAAPTGGPCITRVKCTVTVITASGTISFVEQQRYRFARVAVMAAGCANGLACC